MNRSNQTQTTDVLRFVRCGIGEETYGLDMSWVRSIQRIDRLRRDPRAANPTPDRASRLAAPSGHSPVGWLPGEEGAASLPSVSKGDIPVFSLASRLGRPSASKMWEDGASQRIVVLHPPMSLPQVGDAASLPSMLEGAAADRPRLSAVGAVGFPFIPKASGDRPWALLVDDVSRVIQIPADRLVPLPLVVDDPSTDYFKGVILLNGRLTLFLALERLHPDFLPNASGSVREDRSPEPVSAPGARSRATSAHAARRTRGQALVFHTADPDPAEHTLAFGLSISQIPEILGSLPLTPVPGAAAFVLGLVNWRGRPVPVIDLGRRLGLGSSLADGRTRLVIARDTGRPGKSTWIGFPVRPAIQLLRLPVPHEPSSRSLSIDSTLIRGVVELEGETLVIPDLHTIVQVAP